MREIFPAQLISGSIAATASGTEIALFPYYVSPGKREMKAVLMAYADTANVASDTFELVVKLQESATTVDSDFTDITGAAFTAVDETATTGTLQQIHFQTAAASKYLREYATITGSGSIHVNAAALLVKRDA